MKISVAKTAGFCMGVRRAVDMVLDAANMSDEPIFTYGPLIHNPQVLEMLETKKIHRLDSIPETGTGIVLIRAHGVPPEDEQALESAGFTVMNATCPRVVRVQVIIHKYAKKGCATIIIGDKKHPEVVGLLGYARGNGHTVTTLEQLKELPCFENAVVVAQTTQNTVFFEEIKSWCTENAPHYEVFDTICGSTEKRQTEVRELARTHDAVIVVGGKESGNTRRLAQVAREAGTPAAHIEDVSEIDYNSLNNAENIAITAGASTPNWIISDTCITVDRNLKRQRPFAGLMVRARDFLMKTNLLLAAGAGSLTLVSGQIQGFSNLFVHSLIAMLYVLSMQIMNNMLTIQSDTYNNPDRASFYRAKLKSLRALALGAALVGLYLAFITGLASFFILLTMSLLGLSYNLKILPFFTPALGINSIRDLPGSKTILIALAWGVVTSVLPAVSEGGGILPMVLAFGFSAGLVFARTAFADILAMQGDKIAGKETLPIILGGEKTFKLIFYVLILMILIVPGIWVMGFAGGTGLVLALVPGFMLLLVRSYQRERLLSGMPYEFLFEICFLFAGMLAVLL